MEVSWITIKLFTVVDVIVPTYLLKKLMLLFILVLNNIIHISKLLITINIIKNLTIFT